MLGDQNLKLINKINTALIGTLDFKVLAQQATKLLLKELDLKAAAIFRIDHNTNELKSYAYAVKIAPVVVDKILGYPFTQIRTPLGRLHTNLVEDTVNSGRINTAPNLYDFGKDVVPKQANWLLQKALGAHFHISLPLKIKGAIEGVLFCATHQKSLSGTQINLLKTSAAQLGLAMGNVMAHERIIERYKKSLRQGEKKVAKIPKIKFTLRITPEIEQYLTFKVTNTKESKAEYVRKLLEELMEKDDGYKKFLGPQ